MPLTDRQIQEYVDTIVRSLHPEQIVLFGSYATGQASEQSDLDLLIVMDSGEPSYKRGAVVRKLFWPPQVSMDILVYTPQEVAKWGGVPNHIITEVFNRGRVLYAA